MMKQRQKNKYYEESYQRFDKERRSDSESGEETELFVRNKSPKREIPTIEKAVEDGDTLQSLAIRYHCTIEDLKRINSLHKDNEVFAKRVIKVPYRPFTMALAGVHISGGSSPDTTNVPSTSKLIDIESLHTKLDDVSNTKNGKKNEVNEIIFNSSIKQVPCDDSFDKEIDENCFNSEEIRLLPERRDRIANDPVVARLNWSGADCDIPWVALIVCIVILIFAAPLIYVFYVAEHIEEYHHHNS